MKLSICTPFDDKTTERVSTVKNLLKSIQILTVTVVCTDTDLQWGNHYRVVIYSCFSQNGATRTKFCTLKSTLYKRMVDKFELGESKRVLSKRRVFITVRTLTQDRQFLVGYPGLLRLKQNHLVLIDLNYSQPSY